LTRARAVGDRSYERADVVSNQYVQWRVENACLMDEVTFHTTAFLGTPKEYPPMVVSMKDDWKTIFPK
jgi:hypothetical protein